MPRLPSSQNVPQISPEATRDPGLKIPAQAFESPLSTVTGEFVPAINKLAEVSRRQDIRRETVERARLINQYNEEVDKELMRLNTENDLSREDVLEEFGSFISKRRHELIESHNGSEDSRAVLGIRLGDVGSTFTGRAAGISAALGREKVKTAFNSALSPLVAKASQDPKKENIDALFLDLETQIADLSGAFDPAEEQNIRAAGREQIASSAVDALIARGRIETAASLLDDGGLTQSLSVEKQRDIRRKIETVRYERDEVTRRIVQAEAVMGRPLTAQERSQAGLGLLGLKSGGSEELVEIGDPTSPTGTRFVPRSMAVGKPGKPNVPSGFSMVPDASNPTGVRLKPTLGGPEDIKQQDMLRKQVERARLTARNAKIVVRDIDRSMAILNDSLIPAAGSFIGTTTQIIPGSPAFNLDTQLKSVKSRVSIDELQKVRESSPTGGAFGNVSDRDIGLLENSMGSLFVGQDPKILEESLNQIREIYLNAWFGSPEEIQVAVEDGRMTPEQAKKIEQEREAVGFDAIGRALDPDQDKQKGGKTDGQTDAKKSKKSENQTGLEPEDILVMSRNQLLRLDKEIDSFDDAQKSALEKRMKELGI